MVMRDVSPWQSYSRLRVFCAVVVLAVIAAVTPVFILDPARSHSACKTVYVFYGNPQSPYLAYATTLKELLEKALPEVKVKLGKTDGGADNLYHLYRQEDLKETDDPQAAQCSIAMTKLNVAVDATFGVYQFDPTPTAVEGTAKPGTQNQILGLRTVGPAFDDLLQIVVRDPGITRLEQLCTKRLGIGLKMSGSRQFAEVFHRAICGNSLAGDVPETLLSEGFNLLANGKVDAIIWVNATPTGTIGEEIRNNRAYLLNVDIPAYMIDNGNGSRENVLDRMNDDWWHFYGPRTGNAYAQNNRNVIISGTIHEGDYNTRGIETVGVPNGLVVRDFTDSALVAALTKILLSKKTALAKALWPDYQADDPRKGHQLADVRSPVDGLASSLFCYVPLHPKAAEIYRSHSINLPNCGKP